MTAPLTGIRVIEFGNLIAAPHAAMLLADLGCDVIKIEPPGGDLGRAFGPFQEGESIFFLAANRGKRSIVLDLATNEGRQTAVELCASADVIVNNLRFGAMESKGLGYSDVAATNPGVVYAVISAFGASGPAAERTGIDVVFQAESGMVSISGDEGGPPAKTATTIGDYVAGMNAALAICAALAGRSRTGEGCRIDVSLRDGLVAVQAGWNALAFASDGQPERTGTASPFLAPNQIFETADGLLAVAIVSDSHFSRFCSLLGCPELADRYPTNAERMQHRQELIPVLAETLASRTAREWVATLGDAGLPVGRVLTLPEVWEDPQIVHNQMIVDYQHPVAGVVRAIGSPIQTNGTPALSGLRPPLLGEHTQQVLEGLDRDRPPTR
jgi:crotonobetainyl-CoA:carnitine CoA-transferase CaiB-like acyl-CoA transferase